MIEAVKTLASHFERVNLTEKESRRFWAKVNKHGPVMRVELGPCWEWTAAIWARGYGAFTFRGGQIKSHRLSYLVHHGDIPKDTPFVLHKCDNRKCCNPAHLFLGTYATNATDMCSKGRKVTQKGDDHYLRKHPEKVRRGSTLTMAKLTEEKVRQIRARIDAGEKEINLATEYMVSRAAISLAVNRKTWTHVL